MSLTILVPTLEKKLLNSSAIKRDSVSKLLFVIIVVIWLRKHLLLVTSFKNFPGFLWVYPKSVEVISITYVVGGFYVQDKSVIDIPIHSLGRDVKFCGCDNRLKV